MYYELHFHKDELANIKMDDVSLILEGMKYLNRMGETYGEVVRDGSKIIIRIGVGTVPVVRLIEGLGGKP